MRMRQSDKKMLAFEYEFSFKEFLHKESKGELCRHFGGREQTQEL